MLSTEPSMNAAVPENQMGFVLVLAQREQDALLIVSSVRDAAITSRVVFVREASRATSVTLIGQGSQATGEARPSLIIVDLTTWNEDQAALLSAIGVRRTFQGFLYWPWWPPTA